MLVRKEAILKFLSYFDYQILKVTAWDNGSGLGLFNFFLMKIFNQKQILSTHFEYGEILLFNTYGDMHIFELEEIESIEVISDPVILALYEEHEMVSYYAF
ncbi:hypothetical protein LEP1GSC050_4170 [Leptospira broomii serovar Hurstbridge str. 5399]|uniref:Uncharacterized protein n=1 Tax=Leptospira broomii serovar Hurstbridge str. 5399 TaxID=1049789 RepID=T0FBT7_9LEPT|nr:hypothetical protein LEP1GSC050_4170 [Leptospira broomii serovar Hurstbridge str. 5399]